jgi:hypothetical protein
MLRPEIPVGADPATDPVPADPEVCYHPSGELVERGTRPGRDGGFITWTECALCGVQVGPVDPATCPHPPEDVVEKRDRLGADGSFWSWDECGLCGEMLGPMSKDSVL